MIMKKQLLFCLALSLIVLNESSAAANPTAFLRTVDNQTYYIAVTIGSAQLSEGDLKDTLPKKLMTGMDPLSQYIRSQLDSKTVALIQKDNPLPSARSELKRRLTSDLKRLLADPGFYSAARFAGVTLRPETSALLAQDPVGGRRTFLNRMLLDDAYPQDIGQNSNVPGLWDGRDAAGELDLATVRGMVVASLFQKGRLIPTTIEGPDKYGADFRIEFSNADVLKDGLDSLQVAVHQYPVDRTTRSGFSAVVSTEVVTSLAPTNGDCFAGIPLEVQVDPGLVNPSYGDERLETLLTYLEAHNPTVRVQAQDRLNPEPRTLKKFDYSGDTSTRFVPCYQLAEDAPTGTFDLRFDYPPEAPIELRKIFYKANIVNAAHAVTPFSLDEGNIGKRALEQNLDVGVQFKSSVADKTEKDAAGNDVAVRKRDNKGTLDLRLAPWLNVLSLPKQGSQTFKFLTPLFIDARVSTGKIDKDNLSLNRIVFGSQFEIRKYWRPETVPSYHRFLFTFSNASDRDFKQAEWKGGFEWQPIFAQVNNPLSFRSKNRKAGLDPEGAVSDIPVKIGLGYQFVPLFGVEIGKTWRNKSPFAAIEQSNFVRRVYFGATLTLELTSYLKSTTKNILYVRGEAPQDRLHNYFIQTIELPFPSFTRQSSNSAFFSFERGGQPPFATPDVNTFKIGYRVQWDGWFGQRR
ncbi:MAG: hypothetical protein QOE77_1950 [Blastocatellia bacterium]|jgi:hypothetical protein|nr:hypothetical protein [Blastocatellia bacterium]